MAKQTYWFKTSFLKPAPGIHISNFKLENEGISSNLCMYRGVCNYVIALRRTQLSKQMK